MENITKDKKVNKNIIIAVVVIVVAVEMYITLKNIDGCWLNPPL